MTSGNHDERDALSQPWHNRTPAVVGASVAALAVIAVVVLAITLVSRQFGEPEQAPLNYVEPTYSAPATRSGTATTTQTITSTSPPQTTEIGGPLEPLPAPSATTSSEPTSESPMTEADDDEEDEESTERTTRRGPRTNVTRTFSPLP